MNLFGKKLLSNAQFNLFILKGLWLSREIANFGAVRPLKKITTDQCRS